MKRVFVLILLLVPFVALAQTADVDVGPTQLADEYDYEEELNRLRAGDTEVDFRRLRLAMAETEEFSPYAMTERDLRSEAIAAVNDDDCTRALELAAQIMETNLLYPDAHMIGMICQDKLGHPQKAALHRAVLEGLFRSICGPDEGNEESNPCTVIAVYEEYFVLQALGLQFSEQSMHTCAGSPCDRMTCRDPESGEDVTMYFDTSIVHSRMAKNF